MRSARWTRTPARRSGASAFPRVRFDDQVASSEAGATAKGAAAPSLSVVTAAATALARSATSRLNSASSASKAATPALSVDRAGAEKGEIDPNCAHVAQRPRAERRAGARIDAPADDDQLDAGHADEIGGDVGRVGRDVTPRPAGSARAIAALVEPASKNTTWPGRTSAAAARPSAAFRSGASVRRTDRRPRRATAATRRRRRAGIARRRHFRRSRRIVSSEVRTRARSPARTRPRREGVQGRSVVARREARGRRSRALRSNGALGPA